MKNRVKALMLLLASSLAPCLWAGQAAGQPVAAALALPIDVRFNGRETQIVVTNAGPATTLHVTLIAADWSASDFNCFVTKNETTLFEFRRDPITSLPMLSYECTNPLTGTEVPQETPIDVDQGIMFVSMETPPGGTSIIPNNLFGDATVIDFDQGLAYSFEAIAFQGVVATNGNREYRFNGVEYSKFPANLAANFIAPTQSPPPFGQDEVTAELILFTLDGTIGSGLGPHVLLGVTFYNDDEQRFSATYNFDCFSIVHLDAIDPRFFASALGSAAGHLVLTPQITVHGDLAHDVLFGNSNGVRRTPAHGWLVQTALAGSHVAGSTRYLAGDPAWGRTLAESIAKLVPSTGDIPTLNALCAIAPCP